MNNQSEDKKLQEALAIELAKQEKEVILNSKIPTILEADLDNKGLMDELSKVTLTPTKGTNKDMFRFNTLIANYDTLNREEQRKLIKPLRRKARGTRNTLLNNICIQFKSNLHKELKQSVKEFKSFYKEYYLLNDYSVNSLARSSSDNDKLVLITLGLQIIKNFK